MTELRWPTVSELRSAVREELRDSTLRDVADDIGMSHSGLDAFQKGSTERPQEDTLADLTRWYFKRQTGGSVIPRDQIEMAIAILRAYCDDRSASKTAKRRRRRAIIDRLSRERE